MVHPKGQTKKLRCSRQCVDAEPSGCPSKGDGGRALSRIALVCIQSKPPRAHEKTPCLDCCAASSLGPSLCPNLNVSTALAVSIV